MILAQTAIETASPKAVPPTDSVSNAMWLLVPIAIVCLGLFWYLRRLNSASSPLSLRKEVRESPTAKAKSVSTDGLVVPNVSDTNRQITSSKSSSKKKKKTQSNHQLKVKERKGEQDNAIVAAKQIGDLKSSNDQAANSATSFGTAIEKPEPAVAPISSVPSVPVAAIFEPLRNVVPPRRKNASIETSRENVRTKVVSEEPASRQPTGGKFERMIPSTTHTRTAANRWPASMTKPVERITAASTSETKLEAKQSNSKTAEPISEHQHLPVPASKGLKGFVSKRKAASTSDSVSLEDVPQEMETDERKQ